jgi:hypothetical protein
MLRPRQRSRAQRGQEQRRPDRWLTHSAWLEHCSLPVWMPVLLCATCRTTPATKIPARLSLYHSRDSLDRNAAYTVACLG